MTDHICSLLITLANSLDPDQDQENVSLDLDPNCLILSLLVFLKHVFEKVNFEKSADDKKAYNITQHAKSQHDLLYGPRREKTCLWRFVNNKGADQPAQTDQCLC